MKLIRFSLVFLFFLLFINLLTQAQQSENNNYMEQLNPEIQTDGSVVSDLSAISSRHSSSQIEYPEEENKVKEKKKKNKKTEEDVQIVRTSKGRKIQLPIPVIKIPQSVTNLTWNSSSDYFAYSEKQNLLLRSGNDMHVAAIFRENGDLSKIKFSKQFTQQDQSSSVDFLFTYANSDVGMKWIDNGILVRNINNHIREKDISVIEFSDLGDMFACGTKTGKIYLYRILRSIDGSQSIIGDECVPYTDSNTPQFVSDIKFINFSRDGRFMVTVDDNGNVIIWSTVNRLEIGRFTLNPNFNVGAKFTGDNQNIITARSENELLIRNFNGETIKQINIKDGIRDFEIDLSRNFPTENEAFANLIVLTQKNEFHYYTIKKGWHLGYIPAWNPTPVTGFDYNKNGSKLLVGHEDGTIYVLTVADVFYKPDERPASYKMYLADAGMNSSWVYDAEKGPFQKLVEYQGHNIDIGLDYVYIGSPYLSCFGVEVQWLQKRWFDPFYTGVNFSYNIGFPGNDYEYLYKIDDILIENPYFMDYILLNPWGILWAPYQDNLSFFAEAAPGFSMKYLYSPVIGMGKLNWAFDIGGKAGIKYKNFAFYLAGQYDTVLAFRAFGGVSWEIPLKTVVKDRK